MEYPYVVFRYMATVYGDFRVEFVINDQYQPKETTRAFVVVCDQPYLNGKLTVEAEKALVDAVQANSRQRGLRICVVFSKTRCVYVEPKGAVKVSVEPPSGGVRCIRFPIQSEGI